MAQYMLLLHRLPSTNDRLAARQAHGTRHGATTPGRMRCAARASWWAATSSPAGCATSACGTARRSRATGPYAEAKDVIGGYWLIEARDDAEADAIARDCPHLWNPTNWVELRPIDAMTAAEAPAAAKAAG